MDLNDIIGRICPLPEVPAARIAECAETVLLPKGAMVVEAGRVETDIFFIANGIARAFVLSDQGREVTFWIGAEGTALLSLRSYVQDRPGYENIQLMEDSRLYRLHLRQRTYSSYYIFQILICPYRFTTANIVDCT